MGSEIGGAGGRQLTRGVGEGCKSALNEGLRLGPRARALGSSALSFATGLVVVLCGLCRPLPGRGTGWAL